MTLNVQKSGHVKYVKRPGAVLEAGCVVARLELDDPSKVHPVCPPQHSHPGWLCPFREPSWPQTRDSRQPPGALPPPPAVAQWARNMPTFASTPPSSSSMTHSGSNAASSDNPQDPNGIVPALLFLHISLPPCFVEHARTFHLGRAPFAQKNLPPDVFRAHPLTACKHFLKRHPRPYPLPSPPRSEGFLDHLLIFLIDFYFSFIFTRNFERWYREFLYTLHPVFPLLPSYIGVTRHHKVQEEGLPLAPLWGPAGEPTPDRGERNPLIDLQG